MVDKTRLNGKIVIIGSQNLLLMQSVSQTLAGRVALFTLLPFSIYELQGTDFEKNDIASYIVKSMYPRIYDQKPDFNIWLQDYITTYVERDVRLITSIKDLSLFTNFLKLCAGHTGQIVNFTTLSNNLGIDIKTVKAWLSILETSYIVFLLQPYYNNFNKRIIKAPKLYFYDTGLACSLLGVKSADDYKMHYLRGGLFESFIISEFYKYIFNQKLNSGVYFYRDSNGNEIDTILELNGKLIAVEIKSGQMIIPDFFKGLKTWGKLSESNHDYRFVIYGGEEMQNRSDAKVLGWKNLTEVFNIE
jgi:predicted AAA+ superfamily ATPase